MPVTAGAALLAAIHLAAALAAPRARESVVVRAAAPPIEGSTADAVRRTLLEAGLQSGDVRVYVDGLPAAALPPAVAVRRIAVDDLPFAAERGDAGDGRVDIATGPPPRGLRFALAGDAPAAGGGATRQSLLPLVSGGVPRTPLTFTLSGYRTSGDWITRVQPARVGAESSPPTDARSGAADGAISAALYYSGPVRARVAIDGSSSRLWNSGVGGVALPESGSATAASTRDLRASIAGGAGGWTWFGSVSLASSFSLVVANSAAPGLVVPGFLVAGGAPFTEARRSSDGWHAITVVRGPVGAAGIEAHGGDAAVHDVPNAGGTTIAGTWIGVRHAIDDRVRAPVASPFAEWIALRQRRLVLTLGVRADLQARLGGVVAPRVSFVAAAGAFELRGGAGRFGSPADDAMLAAIGGFNGRRDAGVVGEPPSAVTVVKSMAASLAMPSAWIVKQAVTRNWRTTSASVDYTWTRAVHRFGSRRLPGADGWIDILESNRRAAGQELRARAQYHRGRASASASYLWCWWRDDSDGPFSFPATQSDLAAEWAPASGVAPRQGTLTATVALPRGLALSVVGLWRAGSPVSVMSGRDVEGNGLFTDRGGLGRNTLTGPSYGSLSIGLSRRMPLRRGSGVAVRLGVQADNVLDARNAAAIGQVAGSPFFARPLWFLPGRSVRAVASLGR